MTTKRSTSECEICGEEVPHEKDPTRLDPNLCLRCILAIPKGVAIRQRNETANRTLQRLPVEADPPTLIDPEDYLAGIRAAGTAIKKHG